MKIAVLGAANSGKTSLVKALAMSLSACGQAVLCVPDVRSEWCLKHGRSPIQHEQAALAKQQVWRIARERASTLLVADGTALLTAVHSDLHFSDTSLYASALKHQRDFALTLLTSLDLASPINATQDTGREAFDARLRQVLDEEFIKYSVVCGSGSHRTACAMQAIDHHRDLTPKRANPRQHAWQGYCEKCSDPQCERRLFTGQRDMGHRSCAADGAQPE